MTPSDLKARLTSRKFLLTIGVVAFALIGYLTGQMTFDSAMGTAKTAVLGYLAAEGFGDGLSRFKTGQ